MPFSGMLRSVALVRRELSEELSASINRMTRIGELGTTQAATSNRRTLRINLVFVRSARRLVVAACVVRRQVPPKRQFLQEPHGITSQKTPFFM
jgi:hypothetical protein